MKIFKNIFILPTILLAIASFLFINPSIAHAACINGDFAGGVGTVGDPWQISTPAQLANLSTCTGSTHSK